jgi:3-dehydroquinate dehydratase
MTSAHNRVAVLHGVNFDVLERRDPEVYGGLSLRELEMRIQSAARELGLETIFFRPTPRASSRNTCTGRPSWPTRS